MAIERVDLPIKNGDFPLQSVFFQRISREIVRRKPDWSVSRGDKMAPDMFAGEVYKPIQL